MRPALPLATFVTTLAALAGCAGSTPDLAFSDPEALAASFDLYGGPRAGDVELARTVKVVVDTAVRESDADSHLDVQVTIGRYVASDAPASFDVLTPPGAALGTVAARVGATIVKPLSQERAAVKAIDPTQLGWRFTFPAPPVGQVLEAIVRFTLPGTLASDAQWLAAAPHAGEVLLRYDLPGDAVGAFQVVGVDLRPVVTTQNGRQVIALFVRDAGALPAGAFARYTTTRAAPKGFEQRFADAWSTATADYMADLVAASDGLDGGYAAPFKPLGDDKVAEVFAWVQQRLWPADGAAGAAGAAGASWRDARPLAEPLERNTLGALDRVHLLHWLLRDAHLPHRFAMARGPAFPALAPDFPVPGAFDTPLVQAGGRWLDPGCAACKPGEVRESLRGGQALLLPAPDGAAPELSTLPSATAPETTTTP